MGVPPNTSGVMRPARLAHVVLRTAQFKPMVEFYKTLLGAVPSFENDDLAFLTYDEEHHRVALVRVPTHQENNQVASGLDHSAFTFDTLRDLLTAYEQRKARGLMPVWCINHGPTVSIYYMDPDGNKVETQVECFATPEEAIAFVEGPQYAQNPIGVEFVPEDMLRRLDAGEAEKELMRQPDIGPRDMSSVPTFTPPPPKESYELVQGGSA